MHPSCKGMASLGARIALTIPRTLTYLHMAALPFMMATGMAAMLPCRMTAKIVSTCTICVAVLFRISTCH